LVYKKYKDNKFSNKITVAPTIGLQSHHESMAKIGVTKEGMLFCLFRISRPSKASKYAGALYYTTSKDDGKTWTKKTKLVSEANSSSQSFFDLERLASGELAMIWLDNRFSTREKEGSTLFFTRTDKAGGLADEKPIAFNTCQCCRTDLLIDGQNIKIAFRNIINQKIRDMFYITSNNEGDSFTEPIRISEDNWEIDGCPHTGPSLASNTTTSAVWFTAGQGNKGLFFATKNDFNSKFEKRIEISENGNHPQLVALPNKYYVVYDEYYQKDNTTYQHIKLHKKNNFATDYIFSLSNEETMSTHPVVAKLSDSELLVAWTNLDGDNKKIQVIRIKI
ncbi:MAG: hypothetical protein P8L42_06520, partial [Flavicella sp.]|nr:hypothetical protein [Flavicella sp.]